ncbi:MAG: His/Gly/Thr/Pro-type tRNA ligase C-terminal domain-containing protein [Candidatus Paceibacterota bacterium]
MPRLRTESARYALKEAGIRVELADANESLGKRIRQAKNDRIPYILVVGEQEEKDGSVSAEHFKEGKLDAMKTEALVERIEEK